MIEPSKKGCWYPGKAPWLFLFSLALITACATPESRYARAMKKDSISAYSEFIGAYPDSVLTLQALIRIHELLRIQDLSNLETTSLTLSSTPTAQVSESTALNSTELQYLRDLAGSVSKTGNVTASLSQTLSAADLNTIRNMESLTMKTLPTLDMRTLVPDRNIGNDIRMPSASPGK